MSTEEQLQEAEEISKLVESGDLSESDAIAKLTKTVRAVREERNRAHAENRYLKLNKQYPSADLAFEELDGVPAERWEGFFKKLSVKASESPAPATEEARPEPRQVAVAEESALGRIDDIASGGSPAPKPQDAAKLGRDEALKVYKKDPKEYLRLREAGLVDLGVDAVPTVGGGTRYLPKG